MAKRWDVTDYKRSLNRDLNFKTTTAEMSSNVGLNKDGENVAC